MDIETARWTPAFINIDIYRREDGLLGHTVYKEATYMNLYLNKKLHSYPVDILSVLSTLPHRARAICNQHSLQVDLNTLQSTLRNNRHSQKNPVYSISTTEDQTAERSTHNNCLPGHAPQHFNCISRMLSKYKIKTVGLPPRKTSWMLHPVKHNLGLKSLGIYNIPYDFSKV